MLKSVKGAVREDQDVRYTTSDGGIQNEVSKTIVQTLMVIPKYR